ncbi:DNA polymerase III subunit chi [Ferruginivarius sediminum]|uniref:DNA polymerase III subunit chi n=1 Tax=Ferruginivarius sediminum TaxID=2661937 RepID=A0A369TBS0_9PROT|nr:DNA polymerase III subunit chi [Ferruginivarius sediminum]RDD62791.1 DNA polymerase III subunit chi [Ferruginivarius sediminum]
MTEIRFYHLTRTSLESALPQLLEKTLERGWRALVLASSDDRVEALTAHLWTYDDRSFLPHGSPRDGRPEYQPIWLSAEDANANNANVLFLTDGAASAHVGDFDLVAEMFDGNDGEAVAAARRRWKDYKQAGHQLTYWKQDESGRWQKGA